MLLIGDLDDLVQMQEAVTCSGDISQLRGTVRYMSPEMLRKFCTSSDETPGRKTDIWSLGCVILEMAECHVGKEAAQLHVKDGETDNLCSITPAKFASKIIDGYVPFIREDIPVRLAACARLCLQQDPTSRISAIEMLHELPVVTVTVFASNAALGCIQVLNFDPATNKIHAHELRTPGDLEIQIRSFQLSIPKREIVFQTITNDSRTKLYVWNMNTNDWKKSFTPHHYDPVTSDCHFPVVVNDMICYFRFDHGREAREYDFVQEEVCSYFRYDHGHVTREYDFVQEDVCNANAKVMRLFQCNGLNIHISAVAEFEQKLLYAYNYFLDDLSTGLALYDSLSGEWTHLRDLPQARSRFSMAVVNGYVYILGGKVREKPSSYLWIATTTCIRLNIRTAEWESIHHLRKPRCRHLTGFFNDRIYVCGGRNDANEHALEIEVYDTAREEPWSTVALSAQDQQLLRKIILGEE
ncbi:uncharacterized protein LOC129592362 isoform X2 [Paramacrobiotus metropolitanus]|nr:uncharacterized protein LOC129592362 isoform X2 [Paramacrobiotus metropolitanus]